MDQQPVVLLDQQPLYPGVSGWIECLNETLNGLVVAAFVLASTTHVGLLYQGGKPAFRSFSLASVSRCCYYRATFAPDILECGRCSISPKASPASRDWQGLASNQGSNCGVPETAPRT
jgi:hypothetical protein